MAKQGRHGIAASEKGQTSLRRIDGLVASQRTADLKELLSLPAGRRFLFDLTLII